MPPAKKFETVIETANEKQWAYTAAKVAGGAAAAGIGLSALYKVMQKSRKEAKLAIENKILSTTSWVELNELQSLLFQYKYPEAHRAFDWLNYLVLERSYYIIKYKQNEMLLFATRFDDEELKAVIKRGDTHYNTSTIVYQKEDFPPFVDLHKDHIKIYCIKPINNQSDPALFLYTAWTGPGGGILPRLKNWLRGNVF